ncbi:MAG: cytochrome c [Anaeromyxobacteraceae bacterium]
MKKLIAMLAVAAAALLTASTARAAEPKKSPELVAKGKTSYETNCAACHGAKGLGDGEAGAALDPKPRNLVKDKFKKGDKPAQVHAMLKTGIDGSTMVSFGHLPDEELWGLTYYVLDLRAAKGKK